jgi:hypothetical protein
LYGREFPDFRKGDEGFVEEPNHIINVEITMIRIKI